MLAVDPQTGLTLSDYTWLPQQLHRAFQDTLERDNGIALLFFAAAVDRITSRGGAPRVLIVSRRALYLCNTEAEISRCVSFDVVSEIHLSMDFIGIVVPSQFDMMLRLGSPDGVGRLTGVLQQLCGSRLKVVVHASPEDMFPTLRLDRPGGYVEPAPEPIDILDWSLLATTPGVESLMPHLLPHHREALSALGVAPRPISVSAPRAPPNNAPSLDRYNDGMHSYGVGYGYSATAPETPPEYQPAPPRRDQQPVRSPSPPPTTNTMIGQPQPTSVITTTTNTIVASNVNLQQVEQKPQQEQQPTITTSIIEPLVQGLQRRNESVSPNPIPTTNNTNAAPLFVHSNPNINPRVARAFEQPSSSSSVGKQHQTPSYGNNNDTPLPTDKDSRLDMIWKELLAQRQVMEETCKKVEALVAERDSILRDATSGPHVPMRTPSPTRPPAERPTRGPIATIPTPSSPHRHRGNAADNWEVLPEIEGLTKFQKSLLNKLLVDQQTGAPLPSNPATQQLQQYQPPPSTPTPRGNKAIQYTTTHPNTPTPIGPAAARVTSPTRNLGARTPHYATPTMASLRSDTYYYKPTKGGTMQTSPRSLAGPKFGPKSAKSQSSRGSWAMPSY